MRRVFAGLVILGFFTTVSAANARDRDGKTPSGELAKEPAAASNDSTPPVARPVAREDEKGAVESELQELRDVVQSQSEELHELRTRLAALEAAGKTSNDTPASLAGIIQPSTSAATPGVSTPPTAAQLNASSQTNENKSPLSFKIGSAEFTPGGFLDFTALYRSTNVGSGIATAFGSIPFNNQLPQAGLSETRLSAQYSRLSLKVDANLTNSTALTGYVETDFLGFQPANAYQTANSDSLRLRVYWADVRHGKWEVLGGQAWSLLTPNRVGLSPLTPDLFYTLDEDPNLHPDIIVKTAFDAHPAGHSLHIEAAGLLRSFRVLSNLTTPATTNTITGGGGSLDLNYEIIHNLRLIANSFYSYGGSRYIFGMGPDVIVKPDGTLSGIHAGSGIGGFEYQATSRYMFYGYYGGAYFQRNFGSLPATPTSSCDGVSGFTCVGFGFPGSPNTSNRAIQEGTFAIIPTLWSNENYGRLQIISQYSYLIRSPWSILSASGPNPKNAHTNMVYFGLRYILP